MRKRVDQEWMKHWDFIVLDFLCLQLSLVIGYWIVAGFDGDFLPLNALETFDADALKLDLRVMEDAIMTLPAIFEQARKLHIPVCVEGIESMEQLSVLRKCGATEGQGYFFSHPVPVEEFEEMMTGKSDAGADGGVLAELDRGPATATARPSTRVLRTSKRAMRKATMIFSPPRRLPPRRQPRPSRRPQAARATETTGTKSPGSTPTRA